MRYTGGTVPDDFTTEDPACDIMIPKNNQNFIAPLKQTVFRIRILNKNGLETYEYDPSEVLYGKVSSVFNDSIVAYHLTSFNI